MKNLPQDFQISRCSIIDRIMPRMVFDDIDAGLVLLSLSDGERRRDQYSQSGYLSDAAFANLDGYSNHHNHNQNTRHHDGNVNTVDDDAMDIDSVSSHIENSALETENDQLFEENVPTSTSLVRFLSPTTLGVRYALTPKESPPASPKHDYEFDTTIARAGDFERFSESSGLRRGDSSFMASGPLVFVAPEPAPKQDFGFRQVEVHHHYYGNQMQGPFRGSNSPFNPLSPLFHTPQALQPFDHGAPNGNSYARQEEGLMQIRSNCALENHALAGHQLVREATELPLPWDRRAAPAERMPYVLSSYLQLLVNLVISCYAVHLLFVVVRTIRQDVAHKLEQHTSSLLVEIALCERSYHENNCLPDTIVPALEKMCAYWEKCMHQDPFRGGNTSLVSAHTIGTIVTLLVEPLSAKVLLVAAAGVTLIFGCNFAFGYVRAKTYYGWTGH